MKTKLAIFDVDGTLFDGNLGIDFVKLLIQKEIFSPEIGKGIFEWYGKYKNGEVEKSVAVDSIYNLYSEGMKNLTIEEAQKVALETWNNISAKLHKFAPVIINKLKNRNYKIVLISGSPIEMIDILAKLLEIDMQNIVAGTLEIIDGVYSGGIVSYPGSATQKVVELNKLINKQNLDVDYESSLGMGDNERDLGILELVGHPIAINPSSELENICIKNNWSIVSEENVEEIIDKL